MNDFQQGFYEELEKIALTFDPELTSQLMAGGQAVLPLPEATPQSAVLPLLKTIGTTMVKQHLTESPGGHRYTGYNPPGILTQFRY